MATVRMTHNLRQLIKYNAEHSFDTREQLLENEAPDNAEVSEQIYDLLTFKTLPLLKNIDPGWLKTDNSHWVRFENPDPRRFSTCPDTIKYRAIWGEQRPFPNNIQWNTPLSSIAARRIAFQLYEYEAKKIAFYRERKEFCAQISDLVYECNTLKQLLEAWPTIERLIPDWAMQKHREKVTPKKRAPKKTVVAADDHSLNSTLMRNTLLKGN